MRQLSAHARNLVEGGGPFVGDDRFHMRVTVEPGWWLNVTTAADRAAAQVMNRASAVWRADTYGGAGALSDTSPAADHPATLGSATATAPRFLAHAGANYVYLPGTPGNTLAAHVTANMIAHNEATVPYAGALGGLAAHGGATLTYDPAGIPAPVDDDPDTDPTADPVETSPSPDVPPSQDPLPAGTGVAVDVPAGVIAGGRGVGPPVNAALRAPVLPGEAHTASVDVRVPIGVGYTVAFDILDEAGAVLESTPTATRAGTGDWERVAVTATTPAAAATAGISVRVVDGTATIFDVRRLQVERGETASAFITSATTLITEAGDHLLDCTVVSPIQVRSGGQNWTVHRSLRGYKAAVVDRPVFLFGGGDVIEIPHSTALDVGPNEEATVVAAFRAHAATGAAQTLAAKASTAGYALTLDAAGALRFELTDGTTPVVAVSATPAPEGEAAMAAGRRGATTVAVTYNTAVLDSVTATPEASLANTAPLRIGAAAEIELIAAAVFIGEGLTTAELARVRDTLMGSPHIRPADPAKMPYRWWQRADNSQYEIEIPQVRALSYDHSLEADVDTCNLTIVNQALDPVGEDLVEGVLGDPGYYTPDRANTASTQRWGIEANDFAGVLDTNACIRVYWGYGGHGKTIAQAVADGDILLKGVWLVDDVNPGPKDNTLSLSCRDMFKLVADQDIYPGFIPPQQYPLERCRWAYEDVTTAFNNTYAWPTPTHKGADGWWKRIVDFAMAGSASNPQANGQGYWIVGNDGEVFPFGRIGFHGSMGKGGLVSPITSIESTITAKGYWLLSGFGHVYPFGDAEFFGESNEPKVKVPYTEGGIHYRRLRTTKTGNGYYLMERRGTITAFGDAAHVGDYQQIRDASPFGFNYFVEMAVTQSGLGYWQLTKNGLLYSFGDAIAPGDTVLTHNGIRFSAKHDIDVGPTYHPDGETGEFVRGGAADPTSPGYWAISTWGTLWARRGAQLKPPQEPYTPDQANSNHAMAASQTGFGYMFLAGDGDMFAFGDAGFWGSLRRPRTWQRKIDNDTHQGYRDLTEIVRDLLLWSGFFLHGTPGEVYGNLEQTGTYNEECFRSDFFDKRSVLDCITDIRQIVGYYAWCDEEGAARFESPNFWVFGNFFPDGTRTTDIPVIDQDANLFDWTPTRSGAALRSEIIISSSEPTASIEGTVTTRVTPPGMPRLKGISKPASWVNGLLTDPEEQELMAELVAMQLSFKEHTGTVTCVAHHGIEINDQVWIYERSTGEARVHYVRGVNFSYDAQGGPTMSLTTNRLGTPDEWLVDTEGWKILPRITSWLATRDVASPVCTGLKLGET